MKEQVGCALVEFKLSGAMARLFGKQAILFNINRMTKGGKDQYTNLIMNHQNTNRSVGIVTLLRVISMDESIAMYFKPEVEGKVRTFKMMTLQDIVSKVYIKIGGRKIRAFNYGFKTIHGQFQLWFRDTSQKLADS